MEFLEVPLYDDDILKLLVRFSINFLFMTMVVVWGILPSQRDRNFAFTAVMLNVTVFFICFTMKKLEIDIGMALGLFAIFGVLRYRTDAIGTTEMTFLFIVIGLAAINSLANKKTSYAEIALVNVMIVSIAMLKDRIVGPVVAALPKRDKSKKGSTDSRNANDNGKLEKYTIEYDKVEWLGSQFRELLLEDLRARTGMDITRVQVKTIDLQQNKATLNVWCDAPPEVATP